MLFQLPSKIYFKYGSTPVGFVDFVDEFKVTHVTIITRQNVWTPFSKNIIKELKNLKLAVDVRIIDNLCTPNTLVAKEYVNSFLINPSRKSLVIAFGDHDVITNVKLTRLMMLTGHKLTGGKSYHQNQLNPLVIMASNPNGSETSNVLYYHDEDKRAIATNTGLTSILTLADAIYTPNHNHIELIEAVGCGLLNSVDALMSKEDNDFSRRTALTSLELLLQYSEKFVGNTANINFCEKTIHANLLSGIAFNNAKSFVVNGLGEAFEEVTYLRKGLLAFLIIPAVLTNLNEKQLSHLLNSINLIGFKKVSDFAKAVSDLGKKLGMNEKVCASITQGTDKSFKKEDLINLIVKHVDMNMVNHQDFRNTKVSQEDFKSIIKNIL
ncbi:MAG: hypothetical protein ACRAS9_02290 [Mycoplasma sp.]